MRTLINISELSTQFESISELESRSILGGTDQNPLFTQLFDFSAANLTPEAIAMFKKQVTDLGTTEVGASMLNSLRVSGHKIYVDNDRPPAKETFALGAYESSQNRLHLGALSTDMNNSATNALAFSVIAHELYHAYDDNVTYQNKLSAASIAHSGDVKTEIDAGLFSFMATVQYDISHNLSTNDDNSHSRMSYSLAAGYDTPVKANFNRAWDDIFQNGNFTLENYNKLVENWEGSGYRTKKTTYTKLGSLNDIGVDDFFNSYYSRPGDAKLYKAMLEDFSMTPNQLIQRDPTLHSPIFIDSTGGGSSSGDGSSGGGSYNNDQNGPGDSNGFNYSGYPDYPNNGNYDGGGISDKTGWPTDNYSDGGSWFSSTKDPSFDDPSYY